MNQMKFPELTLSKMLLIMIITMSILIPTLLIKIQSDTDRVLASIPTATCNELLSYTKDYWYESITDEIKHRCFK